MPSQLNQYPGPNLYPATTTYPSFIQSIVAPVVGRVKRYYILRVGRTSVRRVIR